MHLIPTMCKAPKEMFYKINSRVFVLKEAQHSINSLSRNINIQRISKISTDAKHQMNGSEKNTDISESGEIF